MGENYDVVALINGDRQAFKRLFEKLYQPLLAYIITYTHDHSQAEDLVQQAFIDLWEDRGKLDPNKSPKNYIYRIARNRYIDSIYQEKRQVKLLESIWERALQERIEENTEIQEKRIAKIKEVIESLPPKCKRIIELNKIEGLRYKDIAELLDISVKTIEAQMRIAFTKIRKAFKDDHFILIFIFKFGHKQMKRYF
ncbi:RNA polymerase sigma factor [Confluentibacter sediminis]|uniref:RNA polymerase sigma factor n=1 Tax=Confluentibacter sediminis TaxID=2219045 RepID=UPI000DACF74A|nr:RNA polymerase sigma-70 factor [Confluentibacter sediminis]